MRKQRRKPGTQLMENLLNSKEKQGGKPIICYLVGREKLPEPSKKNEKKTGYGLRIKIRFLEVLDQRFEPKIHI